jgi:quinol-cytochrome oxidoreductase complex cytochrome b subunit
MISYIPFIGNKGPMSLVAANTDVKFFVLGSESVGQNALLRFYVLHVVVLPLVLLIAIMFHFWRVRKDNQVKRPL